MTELCKFHVLNMQLFCTGTKGPGLCEDDDLYEDFDMDEMDLNLENYDELFGVTLNNSEELFENGGIDSLFGTKDMSGADSTCQGTVAAEVVHLIVPCLRLALILLVIKSLPFHFCTAL